MKIVTYVPQSEVEDCNLPSHCMSQLTVYFAPWHNSLRQYDHLHPLIMDQHLRYLNTSIVYVMIGPLCNVSKQRLQNCCKGRLKVGSVKKIEKCSAILTQGLNKKAYLHRSTLLNYTNFQIQKYNQSQWK